METLLANRRVLIPAGVIIVVVIIVLIMVMGGGDDDEAAQLEIWTTQDGAAAKDQGNQVAVDSQGDIVMVGYTTNQTLEGQSFVAKYDSEGTEIWKTFYGPPLASFFRALALALDPQDNILVADHWGNLGRLVKFDPSGVELWTREVSITISSNERAWAVATDDQGNAYVVGGTENEFPGETSGRSQDIYIRKYDPEGNHVWTDQFSSQSATLAEGVGADFAQGVAVHGQSVYVVGQVDGTLPGQTRPDWEGNPQADAFIVKYDLDGNQAWPPIQWGTNRLDEIVGVGVDSSGMVYVAGTSGAFPDQTILRGGFVRKFDPDGKEFLWTRQFEGVGIRGTRGSAESTRADGMTVAPNGDVYVVGRVAGTLPDQKSVGGQDAFVYRYDADGNVVWTQQFGTDQADASRGVVVQGSQFVYVTGETTGQFPGHVNSGRADYFIRKLSQEPLTE